MRWRVRACLGGTVFLSPRVILLRTVRPPIHVWGGYGCGEESGYAGSLRSCEDRKRNAGISHLPRPHTLKSLFVFVFGEWAPGGCGRGEEAGHAGSLRGCEEGGGGAGSEVDGGGVDGASPPEGKGREGVGRAGGQDAKRSGSEDGHDESGGRSGLEVRGTRVHGGGGVSGVLDRSDQVRHGRRVRLQRAAQRRNRVVEWGAGQLRRDHRHQPQDPPPRVPHAPRRVAPPVLPLLRRHARVPPYRTESGRGRGGGGGGGGRRSIGGSRRGCR
jgi:hypothetical protein